MPLLTRALVTNGTSAILGQHKACPNRDDNERTRPATTPSARTSQPISPQFVPLDLAHGAYDALLTYISDDVVPFLLPPSAFSQWTTSPFTVDLVEYNCSELFVMASKARLFGATWRSQLYLLLTTPESKKLRLSSTPFRSRFLAARMRTYSPPRQPSNILPKQGNTPGPRESRPTPPRRRKPS